MCFLDFLGGGAWPLVVGGLNRLVNFENERDQRMIFWTFHLWIWNLFVVMFRGSNPGFKFIDKNRKIQEEFGNNRSVMPLDVLGFTRFTIIFIKS